MNEEYMTEKFIGPEELLEYLKRAEAVLKRLAAVEGA